MSSIFSIKHLRRRIQRDLEAGILVGVPNKYLDTSMINRNNE